MSSSLSYSNITTYEHISKDFNTKKRPSTETGYFSVGIFKTVYIVTCDDSGNDGIGISQTDEVGR